MTFLKRPSNTLHTYKWFHVLLYNCHNLTSDIFAHIVCSLWRTDQTLSDVTTTGLSVSRSDGNERLLHIPQIFKTGTLPSDDLMPYPGQSLGESYPTAKMLSVFCTDRASTLIPTIFLFHCIHIRFWNYFVYKSVCESNYQKIRRTLTHDIREHWAAVSTLLCLIYSVYRNLHHWRSNQRPKIVVPKLYNWATSSYHTQVTPNQLVIVIVQPNNQNMSCR